MTSSSEQRDFRTGVLTVCSVGGNQSETPGAFRQLCERLPSLLRKPRVSQIYRTAPQGNTDQPDFLNWACTGYTCLPASELLQRLLSIEHELGRVRSTPNAPRIIDIDILLYGDSVIELPELSLPHPRMRQRAFALIPVLELIPGLRDPQTGNSLSDYLDNLPEQGIYSMGVYPYNRYTHGSIRSGITASFPAQGF